MATKFNFSIESNLQSQYLTDAKFIKGGYLVVATENEMKGMPVVTSTLGSEPNGIIVVGSLCYCQNTQKFYQFLPVTEEKDGVTTTTNQWVNVRLDDVAARLDTEIAERLEAEQSIRDSLNNYENVIGFVQAGEKTLVETFNEALETEANRAKCAEAKLSDTIEEESIRVNEELSTIGEMLNKETTKLDILIGNDGDKSVRTIANEELVAQLIPESAQEALDSLNEIAAWIQQHPEDAASMNAAIALNAENIAKEENRAKEAEKLLDERIAAENSRALAAEEVLTEALGVEVDRAKEAEQSIKQYIETLLFNTELIIDANELETTEEPLESPESTDDIQQEEDPENVNIFN